MHNGNLFNRARYKFVYIKIIFHFRKVSYYFENTFKKFFLLQRKLLIKFGVNSWFSLNLPCILYLVLKLLLPCTKLYYYYLVLKLTLYFEILCKNTTLEKRTVFFIYYGKIKYKYEWKYAITSSRLLIFEMLSLYLETLDTNVFLRLKKHL